MTTENVIFCTSQSLQVSLFLQVEWDRSGGPIASEVDRKHGILLRNLASIAAQFSLVENTICEFPSLGGQSVLGFNVGEEMLCSMHLSTDLYHD